MKERHNVVALGNVGGLKEDVGRRKRRKGNRENGGGEGEGKEKERKEEGDEGDKRGVPSSG